MTADAGASPEFVSRVASIFAGAGFPRMAATVLMLLTAAEEDGLTAEQLAERAGASAAAISGAVRFLEQLGMARRHRARGERRYVWELVDRGWYTATLRQTGMYDEIARLAETELAQLPTTSAARERIAELADFMRFVEVALPRLLEEWAVRPVTGSPRSSDRIPPPE